MEQNTIATINTNTQTTGFFPQCAVKSNGQGYTNQNRKTGPFKGQLKALRPIRSKTNPTVFAVLDIEVPGELGVFQDFLNFNPAKAEQTMSYLVNHVKALAYACGETVNPDEEKDMAWVEQTLTALVNKHATVAFTQDPNKRGLSINY